MDSLTDITLNGETYRLTPGGYQRSPVTAPGAAPERQNLASFGLGLGFAQDDELSGEQGGGWNGQNVHAVGEGSGIEPYPALGAHADGVITATGSLPGPRAFLVWPGSGDRLFLGLDHVVYRSIALGGAWGNFASFADLGVGFAITGLVPYQGDVLVMVSTGQDIRRVNASSGALTIWRAGEKGSVGAPYGNAIMYSNGSAVLSLSGTKWNGNAVTHQRGLDAPIRAMAEHDSEVIIATTSSLYRMGGQPYPGEADDAAVTADTSKAPEWRGDPEPILSHGKIAVGDDLVFLASYRGKIYTWLNKRVAVYDGGEAWTPVGPKGIECEGGCVAGDWLVVAIVAPAGGTELWGFDGTGWWVLLRRASPTVVWPQPLGGWGNWDLVAFRSGSATYDLARLVWRSTTNHTYATSATWISPLLTGRDPGMDKAWHQIDAWFAWPELPGNPASGDSVTIALDYSSDAGATWTEIDTATVSIGREQHLTHRFTAPPVSRLLQTRVRWSSVSDWAPILSHIDVDFAVRDTRQRWTLDVAVRDQLEGSGRDEIDALWDAWREAAVPFRDIDYDTNPQERTVRVLEVAEKAPGIAGSGQEWTGSIVSVQLGEV